MPSLKNSRQKKSLPGRNGRGGRTRPLVGVEVRQSPIHGRGVFAKQSIPKGTRIIEYTGRRMPWRAVPNEDNDPHTFIFGIGRGRVINAAVGGNEARWINHSCTPNCEAVGRKDRIFIYALRNIRAGEELFYDYALQLDEPITPQLIEDYKCGCGTSRCRGTMLEVK